MIHETAIIEDKSKIDEDVIIDPYVIINGNVVIGKNTSIGSFTTMFGGLGIKIGNDVAISTKVTIAAGNHAYNKFDVPMGRSRTIDSVVFNRDIKDGFNVVIEDGVWIGSNVTITDSVIIEEGAVVGAGAVVTKSVNKFDIVAGVPAKVIGNRKSNPIFIKSHEL